MAAVDLRPHGGHSLIQIGLGQLQRGPLHQGHHIGGGQDLGSGTADALGGHLVGDLPGQGVFGGLFHNYSSFVASLSPVLPARRVFRESH